MSDAIAEQRELWSAAPRDWAELAEPQTLPLFNRLLGAAEVGPGKRMLDIACGSGLACALAAERGADVAGIDVTPELLAIARERVASGDFQEATMDALPFPSGAFDVVTCVNGFQFAADPVPAIREAARVLAPGGLLGAAAFAEPERNEGTVLHLAMRGLASETEDGYTPYALSTEAGLRGAISAGDLRVAAHEEVPVTWRYQDVETTVRALLASAGGARSVRAVGRVAVRDTLIDALEPFIQPDGSVKIENLFRYVLATA